MKALFEEYGTFIIAVFIGIVLAVALFATALNNDEMDKWADELKEKAFTGITKDDYSSPEITMYTSVTLGQGSKLDPEGVLISAKTSDGESYNLDEENAVVVMTSEGIETRADMLKAIDDSIYESVSKEKIYVFFSDKIDYEESGDYHVYFIMRDYVGGKKHTAVNVCRVTITDSNEGDSSLKEDNVD